VLAAIAVAWRPADFWLLAPVLSGVALLAPLDCRAMAMMGDVGANSLGAMAGLALAAGGSDLAKLVAIALLALLHLFAERASITRAITASRPLRWLDRLGCEAGTEAAP
jgi:UDP-N-acetylmuramyl pentapeptide phosphotransferase/UDP-N-acetylglucosamine-1-phosphate transferase